MEQSGVVARVCGEAAADGVRRATGGIYRAAERPCRARPGRKSGVIPGRVSRLAVARPGEAGETTGPTSGPSLSAKARALAGGPGGVEGDAREKRGAGPAARRVWEIGASWAVGERKRGMGRPGWRTGPGREKGRWERESGLGPVVGFWTGLVWGLGYGFLFYFFFFFFCKLTQTSLNSNKFEFKLPSTQPK